MDSVKQVDEAIAADQAWIDLMAPFIVCRVSKADIERLRLRRIAILQRVRREQDALRWIAYEAPDKAKIQETIAAARFEAVKSGDGLAVLLANYKLLRSI